MLRSANLLLRFLLELAGLFAAGIFGFTALPGPLLNWLVGIGLPLLMAAAWGIFRIPDDGGAPVVTVSGQVRLALEAAFFTIASGGLVVVGHAEWAAALLILVAVCYGIDHRRTLDLLFGRR